MKKRTNKWLAEFLWGVSRKHIEVIEKSINHYLFFFEIVIIIKEILHYFYRVALYVVKFDFSADFKQNQNDNNWIFKNR